MAGHSRSALQLHALSCTGNCRPTRSLHIALCVSKTLVRTPVGAPMVLTRMKKRPMRTRINESYVTRTLEILFLLSNCQLQLAPHEQINEERLSESQVTHFD